MIYQKALTGMAVRIATEGNNRTEYWQEKEPAKQS
jgi:hypothetical protein